MTETIARPTRRTLVRAAAWSVPVVSIAAAAPAFAASGSSTIIGGTAEKWGSGGPTKHVSWDLTLTNGAVAIDTIEFTFTYTPNGGGTFTAFSIYSYSPLPTDHSWTFPAIPVGGSPTVTATHLSDIAANTTTSIHTDFAGADASAGTVSATATIKYVGSATTVTTTIATVSWASGNQHVHPA